MGKKQLAIMVAGLMAAIPALAREHSMGNPVEVNGMILRPVYLQPVHMAPAMPGMNEEQFDAHLEIDVHADKNNPYGFDPGAWIPYLMISYELKKVGSDWSSFDSLVPMIANDGPHYGANIKFDGPGKYQIRFHIAPPPYNAFFRHTDKETGVPAWWIPFEEKWDFTYIGVGHKGGY